MGTSEKCHNNGNNSDNRLTSRRTDGDKKGEKVRNPKQRNKHGTVTTAIEIII